MPSQMKPIIIGDYEYNLEERSSFSNGPIRDLLVKRIFANFEHYIRFVKLIERYIENLHAIPVEEIDPASPYWKNGWLPTLDAISLYITLAEVNPRYYIEIGSGNSTKFARRCIEDNKLRTQIISIDPNPRCSVNKISDTLIKVPLESYNLDVFRDLSPEDIVMMDGSHRAMPNSDVTVFFCELLPKFPRGMLYTIHDIALPDELYVKRCYNEQYMLATYLLGGAKDDIYLPNHYILNHTGLLDTWKQEFDLNARSGKFFWLRKA